MSEEKEIPENEELDEEVLEEVEAEEIDEDDEDVDAEVTADPTAELEKRYLNLFAEYENYRKRSTKEKEDLYASAVASVTKDWLQVLDNIDRAIDSAKSADENSVEKVMQGVEMIGKQASDILAKLGVEVIECERGTKFDPNLHEAVMHVDDDSLGEQEIAAVFQKGYIYKDRVVRHAVVQVAN